MHAEVVSITRERSCRAHLGNEILVVFQEPPASPLKLGDRLRFDDLRLDADVRVFNLTNAQEFTIYVAARDVHDLRLPAGHGGSRTPTAERLRAP